MRRLLLLLCFVSGCVPLPPRPPTPIPPAEKLVDIAVTVKDSEAHPLAKATCTDGGRTITTNGDGWASFGQWPEGDRLLACTKPGYSYVEQAYRVVWPNPQTVPVTLSALHIDPATVSWQELAAIRGDMWASGLDLPFGPRPHDLTNVVGTPYLSCYTISDQQRLIQFLVDQGYTHVVIGSPVDPGGYHGMWCGQDWRSNWDGFLDLLQTYWDAGLKPIVFIHPDGWDFATTKATFEPLLKQERSQRLIRIVVMSGWEPAKYEWSSCTWALYFKFAREVLPNALSLAHTVSDVDAMVGTDTLCNDDDHGWNPEGNAGGWAREAPYLHGWLIQNGPYAQSPYDNPSLANEFAAQFDAGASGAYYHSIAWHFWGAGGWTRDSAWGPGQPVRLYAAEQTAYNVTWNSLPSTVAKEWGDLAMQQDHADGYLNGGTVPVPVR